MKDRKLIWVAAAVVLGVLASGCAQSIRTKPEPQTSAARATIVQVEARSILDTYEATGSVKALLNATLSSKVMGRVLSVSAREGDRVKNGQVLVSLDPRELQANVAMAQANYQSGLVGVSNAKTAAAMEAKTSSATIQEALAHVEQAKAALASAQAKRDLVLAGPRPQEVDQAHLAVIQSQSTLSLAQTDLERIRTLVDAGALARRELDVAQNKYDVAKSQYDVAVQAENIAREGSRAQDIRAAQQAVAEAGASLKQAEVGVTQAHAAAMQTQVRVGDIQAAKAQVSESSAAIQSAKVALSYAVVVAPFDGQIVQRLVDPGAMANPGTPLIGIEGCEYRLEVSVPEEVLRSVRLGTLTSIRIDALGSAPIIGKVVEINPQASGESHSFVVKFGLAQTPGLRSGMFGRANIQTGKSKRILIPQKATWEKEGLRYVYAVNKENLARLRIVTLGDQRGDNVEVLSGLSPGERIVASDPQNVSDGERIEAVK